MAPPPLPIIADDDSTRDDGLLAQVALAQLLVEFQQAQTAQPLGVKDRRVKQVELSLGYRMLQYRWNTSSEGPSTGVFPILSPFSRPYGNLRRCYDPTSRVQHFTGESQQQQCYLLD